ncbi:hypothetical protein HFN80_16995 [Rhizobium laguerreae]|uniref:hypothetical protein n=1 Tax=Rhizobium laguerreae TaxID=1076926 RepID=UPI001C91A639|nr:hypothetical protein [Rhizobium laguerreae]MBY3465690.1 hypothetical protein [Rhizobium laguerreae]
MVIRHRIRRLCFRKDDKAAIVIGPTKIGQTLATRGSMPQARAQPLLKKLNMFQAATILRRAFRP